MNIFIKSKKIREKIEEIILKKGLNKILENYGKVFYTGSYFLDVMIWPDIDIELSLKPDPFSLELFFKLGKEIASIFTIKYMTFHNRIDFPIIEKGLYWNISLVYEKIDYNIDLWSLPENILTKHIDFMNQIKNKITNEKRKKIIEIKSALIDENGRTPKFSGFYIYQAILNKNLKDIKEIKDYLINNGVKI